ncbi:MAG: hypothetical protein ACTSR8_21075 [Promethearchaeota archaeon]
MKQVLDWLFDFNPNKSDFVNYILSKSQNWGKIIANLVQNLRKNRAIGIQDKFNDLGFNQNTVEFLLKPRLCELEVGNFLTNIGEKVQFLEGNNSPDLISGITDYDKVWEVSTIFDSPEMKKLWTEGNNIINAWNITVKVRIKLSLFLSNFRPERSYHENFERIVGNSLDILRQFDPSILKPNETYELRTPAIFYYLTIDNSGFSGISTILEGGIEEMGFLETADYNNAWVTKIKERILQKSKQLINNISIFEQRGVAPWNSQNYRLIAIVTDAYVFDYESYFKQCCFGSSDIHSTTYINDPRLNNLQKTNKWYDYIKNNFFNYEGRSLKEPKGVFLQPETKNIHGVHFISSNRSPIEINFLPNPFVKFNNNPDLINYLKEPP